MLVGRSNPDAPKARKSQHALTRFDRMHVSSHAKGRLTRVCTRSSAKHDADCPCTTPSVDGAGKNLVQHVRHLGSLKNAGVG
jgi:hypothetical protein